MDKLADLGAQLCIMQELLQEAKHQKLSLHTQVEQMEDEKICEGAELNQNLEKEVFNLKDRTTGVGRSAYFGEGMLYVLQRQVENILK